MEVWHKQQLEDEQAELVKAKEETQEVWRGFLM
jgi:hypothetical protein